MKLKITAYFFVLGAISLGLLSTKSDTNVATTFQIPCTTFGEITSEIPTDATILNQYCVNSFAWQAFLALNWPAKQNADGSYVDGEPAAVGFDQVGLPGDLSATVWETYADANAVFNGETPPIWAENQIVPLEEGEGCSEGKIMRHFNKLTSKQPEDISSLFQASGPQWLISQDNELVWYEVMVNETEFDFIYNNKLYDFNALWNYGEKENGIWLPNQSMELKASWLQFSDDDYENNVNNIKDRYKIVKACVPQTVKFVGKNNNKILSDYQPVYLGLIGLHIITKTPTAPQLIWATFEHVDNVPTENTAEMNDKHEFYNPNCSSNCDVNTPFPITSNSTLSTAVPNQTTRLQMNSIGKDAKILNAVVKQKIIEENPQSVWQNYQLVNVQWPNTAVPDEINTNPIKLEAGGAFPTVRALGNPVAETYVQDMSCMNCHQFSFITNPTTNATLTTGYSFVFNKVKPQIKKN